jgi:putative sugar O-methyltransferase
MRANRLISQNSRNVLFVTPLLRAREIKMAAGLRKAGWTVVLLYSQNTPFNAANRFDAVIRAHSDAEMHKIARQLRPALCHVFSGAVDDVVLQFCRDKPSPVVIDMNDVFSPSLFNYCEERFEPTKECLALADGLCARDLQANYTRWLDGNTLPSEKILFPEYCWNLTPDVTGLKKDDGEVRVVSIGTFCLEKQGLYDSGYLKLARLLTAQKIHLHIYPHWFYRTAETSSFNWSLRDDFSDFFDLQNETSYLHIHESLPLDELAAELQQYDFGIVSGGSPELDQTLSILKEPYLECCYSGRISDYLDARLPVLVNPEVRFNYRLMKRYGTLVDLNGVLEDDFKGKLLDLKRDSSLAERVKEAASELSLEANIPRLSAFYNGLIAKFGLVGYRAGPLEVLTSRIPGIRGASYRAEALMDKYVSLHATNAGLPEKLTQMKHQSGIVEGQTVVLREDLKDQVKENAFLVGELKKRDWQIEKLEKRASDLIVRMRSTLQTTVSQEDNKSNSFGETVRKSSLADEDLGVEAVEPSNLDDVVSDLVRLTEEQTLQLYHLENQCHDHARRQGVMTGEALRLAELNRNQAQEIDRLLLENQTLSERNATLAQVGVASLLEAEEGTAIDPRVSYLRERVETLEKDLLEAQAAATAFRTDLRISGQSADELSGLLGWPEIRDQNERLNGFHGLLNIIDVFAQNADEFSRYSEAWIALSKKNFDQLLRDGFNNFKRTIATNYFTFIVQSGDPQLKALEALLTEKEIEQCRLDAASQADDPDLGIGDQFTYRYFVHLLWTYAKTKDVRRVFQELSEPTLGNPFRIYSQDQLISQDLANSMLEYLSMSEVVDFAGCKKVLEVGGGYGRDAHVILSLNPRLSYFFVDVPPSIFIAQKYIAKLFPDRTVFAVQNFSSFEDVKEEMEKASLVFLLPHQLKMVPEGHFDLTISISNLGEMTKTQISEYTQLIGRKTNGHIYNKQWNSSINPFDDQVIESGEYPVLDGWCEVYRRNCETNPEFFESLHAIEPTS